MDQLQKGPMDLWYKCWERKGGLSSAQLKLIACLSMLLDHIAQGNILAESHGIYVGNVGDLLANQGGIFWGTLMTLIGRIAFPIFCFFAAHGAVWTRSPRKMILRLFLFACITEPFFDLVFFDTIGGIGNSHQNVLFTMCLAVSGICIMEKWEKKIKRKVYLVLFRLVIMILTILLAEALRVDYGGYGVIALFIFYFTRDSRWKSLLFGFLAFFFEAWMYGMVYLGLMLLYFYNGKRGKMPKYFFYGFYPGHLLILYLIRQGLLHFM